MLSLNVTFVPPANVFADSHKHVPFTKNMRAAGRQLDAQRIGNRLGQQWIPRTCQHGQIPLRCLERLWTRPGGL